TSRVSRPILERAQRCPLLSARDSSACNHAVYRARVSFQPAERKFCRLDLPLRFSKGLWLHLPIAPCREIATTTLTPSSGLIIAMEIEAQGAESWYLNHWSP